MRRSKDIIVKILAFIEENDATLPTDILKSVPDTVQEVVRHHINLCVEARLLRVNQGETPTLDLTWKGYDYLDRNRTHGE